MHPWYIKRAKDSHALQLTTEELPRVGIELIQVREFDNNGIKLGRRLLCKLPVLLETVG